jgi:hypothetical protein
MAHPAISAATLNWTPACAGLDAATESRSLVYVEEPIMVLFKAKSERDPRANLAAAINERDTAARALKDAKVAEDRAREAYYAADAALAEVRTKADAPRSPDELVAALSVEGHVDIIELDKPAAEIRAEIEVAEQKVQGWRRALDLSEQAVPARERALDIAESKVKQRAAEVFATQIDVPKLLAEAQIGADWIVGQRAAFIFLMTILPAGPDHDAIAHFMIRPWLLDEQSGDGWRRNPSIKPFSEALEALLRDPNAEVSP